MEVGEKIKKIRKERKLTQKQLASIAQISNSFLCDIEKGRSNPSLESLKDIAKALDKDIRDFFD